MSLRDLDYQARTLALLDEYLIELSQQKKKADKISEANARETDLDLIREIPDFAAKTWEVMHTTGKLPQSRAAVPYSTRADGVGRPVPNVVFKVPTGGGKTYLAVSALSRIFGRYLGGNTGFVLWIVPNEAIYSQTKKQLADRQHPYRQMLDVQSGNRVKLMQKDDRLDARDVEGNLCVMLLMLQSSNRENQATLRMFRDRGDVQGFFPPEGDMEAHRVALELTPNLDAYGKSGEVGAFWPMVKDSLGNALRLIRPVVVMDEGHRAVSELAFATLYGFNPCFVLELSATPKDVAATNGRTPRLARYANVLVEVKGIDLDREGMIKMPLNLDPRQGTDWRNTLAVALDRLNTLDGEARRLHGEQGRYIRPIMLVQAERTGADQRDGSHIHALDVKEWLVNAGLDEAEIAVKTADTNDLAAPENQDLLSPTNRVRVIITKQALQEGWDCPFAYVLCALSASGNLDAMTQLVGRILRQPHAEKTGVAALDECYVITHHAGTADVVTAIKSGLEEDGMGDLVKEIHIADNSNGNGARKVKRRTRFAKTEIFLPLVLRTDGGSVRPLDYEQDILFDVDWTGLDVTELVTKIPDNAQSAEHQMRRIHLADIGDERIVSETVGTSGEILRFDPAYAVRMISDIVPNAWVAREIVGKVKAGLQGRGFDDAKFGELAGLLVEELRKWLDGERDRMAKSHFRDEVAAGRIQFRLRADGNNWRMPFETETYEPETADQLVGRNGGALERSLFSPIYKGDFSSQDERDIAVYLDGEAALGWWHRNVARNHYAVQGWRREKVYPDFIFAVQRGEVANRLVVLEMKGQHLSGNPDTEYKKAVLHFMNEAYDIEHTSRVGELELVVSDGTTVECDLVLMTEWKTRLPNEFLCG
jgi:type III restriction enzyme